MINRNGSDKTQVNAFINQIKSHWKRPPSLFDSYNVQRHRFTLKRLRLQAQLMLIVGLTVIAFFLWLNVQPSGKFSALTLGVCIEIIIGTCLFFSKTQLGYRHPHLIFLSLSWSVTCINQIGTALLFHVIEPRIGIWNLMFLTQATMVPVLWHLHMISQIGTIFCYLTLYGLFHPTLKYPFPYYVEQGLYLFWTCVICNLSVYFYDKLRKEEFHTRKDLEVAQEKSDKLLLNILPETIASKLKHQRTTIADHFHEVTVLFADIVGFTELSSHTSPTELVELLNEIFSKFDKLAEQHGVEKIKTIGDAYMAVAGLPIPRSDHALTMAKMALDMQRTIQQFNQERDLSFRIRIGISTGPVVAGVIGLKKFTYDLWGDTVNTASRMESHGIADCIQVCEASYERLKDKFLLEKRGLISVKGKGKMMTYLLKAEYIKN
ncbi:MULTISPECIES: adenylate/guanylate cyclase domain-containing protein [Nostocales]|uniref:Adenylate cyclase n=3 Tax=Nostocales TaxID=1161 RepID=A0A0C1QVK4_9CYAN|nr:adenylate/guanylate cyclase domain-containing protein [Tolypothrix bouteillei]KAF3890861.1 adenylate/guanylate cyclase domain-containing protein [Tolypothrix bouteillei VB521301]